MYFIFLIFDFYFPPSGGASQPIGHPLHLPLPAFSHWCLKKKSVTIKRTTLCSHFVAFVPIEESLWLLANLTHRQHSFFSKLLSGRHCVLFKSASFLFIRVIVFQHLLKYAAMSHSTFVLLLLFFWWLLRLTQGHVSTVMHQLQLCSSFFFFSSSPPCCRFKFRARNSCVTSAMKPWSKGCVMEGRCAKMWRNF